MIRAETPDGSRPAVNPLRGEFEVPLAGTPRRFDTRLATIAAIEAACGDRPIVEVLNGVILGRRARDVIGLIEAALGAADPPHEEARALAARASVTEAEAFVLALVFALGFRLDASAGEAGQARPLDVATPSGSAGAPSRSAA